jgi:hypothetical protein
MKLRFGTFPREVKLFDADGIEVSSKTEEGFLLAIEVTKKEASAVFGETEIEKTPPGEILRKLADGWEASGPVGPLAQREG